MDKRRTLDLHGVRHHDVDRIVENFIFINQDHVPLEIICGNSKRMIDLVNAVIEKHSITASSFRYGVINIYRC